MHALINPEVAKKYEPSTECKERWLFTRKKKLQFQGLTLNGFFQTDKFKRDQMLVILVLGLEIYGFYVLWNILPNPLLSLTAFPLDVFCAIMSHLYKKKLVIARTKKTLAHFGDVSFSEGKSSKYEEDLQSKMILKCKLYEFFWYVCISALALLKVISIFSYATLVPGVKLLFVVMYITTAIIHISITGYWLAELYFRSKVKKELKYLGYTKKEDLKQNDQAILIYRKFELQDIYNDVVVNMQKVLTQQNPAIKTTFYNWGILQDDELLNLVMVQKDIQSKERLAIELLYCQHDILKSEANRIDELIDVKEEIEKVKLQKSSI